MTFTTLPGKMLVRHRRGWPDDELAAWEMVRCVRPIKFTEEAIPLKYLAITMITRHFKNILSEVYYGFNVEDPDYDIVLLSIMNCSINLNNDDLR